ncbi:hypothetical protein [Ktedonobacter racemifer]|uniref:Ig-like domain-containing protein n=1 Tax=Ktedonobacter racemifer DSM 44963 TaxID=485913 RepID=D6TZI8_KTERA|nr:hypothetical protein [Ktedonobacter racemifer]EFH81978.1 hypothetical protein Krac_2747 [Ktedonobacter racemifer DSM 44963]
MLRMFSWRKALVMLVVSMALVLGTTQAVQAHGLRHHHHQVSPAICQVSARAPALGQTQQVTSASSIQCARAVTSLTVNSRLEVNVGGSWYKLSESNSSGPSSAKTMSAAASAACSQGQTLTFRSVASGSYQDSTDWHQVPENASSEVALKCA